MGDCCHCVFSIKVVKDKNVSSIPKYGLFIPGISWRYIFFNMRELDILQSSLFHASNALSFLRSKVVSSNILGGQNNNNKKKAYYFFLNQS